jgi:tetratricopeptide (TPR) repeat protein
MDLARAALATFRAMQALELTSACEMLLASLYFRRGDLPSGAQATADALTHARAAGRVGDHDVHRFEERARRIWPELNRLGRVFLKEGDLALAERYARSARELAVALRDEQWIEDSEFELGIVKFEQTAWAEAEDLFEDVRRRASRSGRPWTAAECLHEIGQVQLRRGDLARARAALELCLTEKRAADPTHVPTETMSVLAQVLTATGANDEAYDMMRACVDADRESGSQHDYAESLSGMALICWEVDRMDEAERVATEALDLSERYHMMPRQITNLLVLGEAAIAAHDFDLAEQRLRRAIHLARSIDFDQMAPLIDALERAQRRTP